jgi:hypothetical protein
MLGASFLLLASELGPAPMAGRREEHRPGAVSFPFPSSQSMVDRFTRRVASAHGVVHRTAQWRRDAWHLAGRPAAAASVSQKPLCYINTIQCTLFIPNRVIFYCV